MKTKMSFIFFVVVLFAIAMFSSCEEDVLPVMTTTTVEETSIIETSPGSGGVIFAKEITVKDGETVWGYSNEVYGSGGKWRDIVMQNKFLQEPGRVYWDTNRKQWIAKIYPGEVVKIDGQVVLPTYIFYDKTTTISQPLEEQEEEKDGLAWYWIVLIILGAIGLGVWISSLLGNNNNRNPNVHTINVRPGQDFNNVTQANIDMARYDRACRATENAANQMFGRGDLIEANASTVFNPNGEINFSIRGNYQR